MVLLGWIAHWGVFLNIEERRGTEVFSGLRIGMVFELHAGRDTKGFLAV